MKKLEDKIWGIAEMGPKTILGLVVIAIVMLILWGNLLGIKIAAIVILIYSIGETTKWMGCVEGLKEERIKRIKFVKKSRSM